jgi:hypothetical protein
VSFTSTPLSKIARSSLDAASFINLSCAFMTLRILISALTATLIFVCLLTPVMTLFIASLCAILPAFTAALSSKNARFAVVSTC